MRNENRVFTGIAICIGYDESISEKKFGKLAGEKRVNG